MASQTFSLIDQATNTHAEPQQWKNLGSAGASMEFRRLQGGLSDGVDVLEIDNGAFRFAVLPTRGMGIWKAWSEGMELGWQSPVPGPVHPKYVPLTEPSGLGWLDGFDELLCRCGLVNNGAPEFGENGQLVYPLHGQIANRPARKLDVHIDGNEISVVGVVEEIRFHFAKLRLTTTVKTRFGESGIRIHDEIENLSASDAEVQMLYHINFGAPFLNAGSELRLPYKKLVPRNDWSAEGIGHWSTYTEPTAGMAERVYFFEPLGDVTGNSLAMLKNAKGDRGAVVRFNTKQLPCFSQWKNETSLADGYVTGLEPGTNFPNPRSFEGQHGRFAKLGPASMVAMDLAIETVDQGGVVAMEAEIETLQAKANPDVSAKPTVDWCA
ncbi:MAG: aldose 1-epimerase family protein [Planctomycetales bacterium]|nr:aldose 1-epimerase family protein [Planctomycetales bacterium]